MPGRKREFKGSAIARFHRDCLLPLLPGEGVPGNDLRCLPMQNQPHSRSVIGFHMPPFFRPPPPALRRAARPPPSCPAASVTPYFGSRFEQSGSHSGHIPSVRVLSSSDSVGHVGVTVIPPFAVSSCCSLSGMIYLPPATGFSGGFDCLASSIVLPLVALLVSSLEYATTQF